MTFMGQSYHETRCIDPLTTRHLDTLAIEKNWAELDGVSMMPIFLQDSWMQSLRFWRGAYWGSSCLALLGDKIYCLDSKELISAL